MAATMAKTEDVEMSRGLGAPEYERPHASGSMGKVAGDAHRSASDEQEDAESDVDELVDSDADEAANGPPRGSSGKVGRPRGSKNGSGKRAAANGSGRNGVGVNGNETHRANGRVSKIGQSAPAASSRPGSNAGSRRASPARGQRAPSEPAPPLPADQRASSDSSRVASSSREILGRTATGGPVPYYYPQPDVGGPHRPHSPPHSTSASSRQLPKRADEAHPDEENLNGQEVDKFLDLIEKHNLDQSDEEAMARAVTELYQEWLEWCAKRNVVSTKSKQALVAEFERIHHGVYGAPRQQRAIRIVQGSRAMDANGRLGGGAFGLASSVNGARGAPRASAPLPRDVDKKPRGRGSDGSRTSPPRGSAVKPAPTPSYDDNFARGIPPAVIDNLYNQIRADVLREAGGLIQRALQESYGDLVHDNNELAQRVAQLELHSDNLAQWVQHLNHVQEETAAAAAASAGPIGRDGPMLPREDVIARDPYHPAHERRDFGPGPGFGPASPSASFVGGRMPRRSVTPPMAHRPPGRGPNGAIAPHPHDVYERPLAPPIGMAGGPPGPPHGGGPAMAPAHAPPMREPSRGPHSYTISGHGPMPPQYESAPMRGGPPPPPGAGGRGAFYGGPAYDERGPPPPPPSGMARAYDHGPPPMHAGRPPSPPLRDQRQLKRARNGF